MVTLAALPSFDLGFTFVALVLSVAILVLLVGLSYAFAGLLGIGAFAAATVVGLIPPKFGARRVHLMDVLIGPLILG